MPFGHLKKVAENRCRPVTHILPTSVFCMKQFTYRYNTQNDTTHTHNPNKIHHASLK